MRKNEFGQPMITQALRDQLWDSELSPAGDPLKVRQAKKQLAHTGFPIEAPEAKTIYQITPELPAVLHPDGRSLKDRLESLIGGHTQPIKARAEALINSEVSRFDISSFKALPGWTRYAEGEALTVPYPDEDAVIDFETMVKFGNWPVMGAAVSTQAWYIWLHPALTGPQAFYGTLVPTNPNGQLYFAWNAGFDRSMCSASYLLETPDVWLDGMSFHMGSYGLSSDQRKKWEYSKEWAPWAQVASPKSLLEACELHVPGLVTKEDKELREVFVEATSVSLIKARLEKLVSYCANDVYATHRVLKVVWPRFKLDNPSPLSFAGMVQLSRSLLPVDPEWPEWVQRVENVHESISNNISQLLTKLALEVAISGYDLLCPWTSGWNWDPAKSGKNAGQPHWLRTKVLAKGKKLGHRSRLAPALLKLRWMGHPIFHDKKFGWVYYGPLGTGEELTIRGQKAWRVPHEKGDDVNVGSPLAKGYIEHYENGLMTSDNPDAKVILDAAAAISYWTSSRERVMSQKAPLINGHRWIVPKLENYGTTTRRAVEPLWLTVPSAKPTKVGTELKGMVRAPKGFKFGAADYGSQEMVVLAGLTERPIGVHGSTGIGFIVMSGATSDKTDTHSLLQARLNARIAELRGLDPESLGKLALARQQVKGPNYAVAYGAGVRGLSGFIKQAKPMYTNLECEALASETILYMKGRKVNGRYLDGIASDAFNDMEATASSRIPRTPALGSAISCGLRQDVVGRDYMPSRCNWRIQSCGRDLLDILVAMLDWLFQMEAQVNPDFFARFLFSYHDEVLTLFKEGYDKRVAELLNIAHLYAWAVFYEALDMPDVPANLAWFGSVNIDTCFRKEVSLSQLTPSNNIEVPYGYDIFPGAWVA